MVLSKPIFTIVLLLIAPLLIPNIFAHTVDSIAEQYRIEIGWMNEPVVSGETNGIEIFLSPLEPGLELEEQEFKNGVKGLEKDLKMQLVFKDQKITLPFSADHNIPGKYYAFVDPTVSGYYQANILGEIKGIPVSLSMHPPKVNERSHIEFPEKEDLTVEQIIDGHTALIDEISSIKNNIKRIEESNTMANLGYAGIGLGIAGILIASIAFSKTRK